MAGLPIRRKQKPDSRDGWYEISPAAAATLLEERCPNRPLREWRAIRYSIALKEGRWRPNGEALIFDTLGRNLDGQHRLRGCVISGIPLLTYCVFAVPVKLFATMGQGAPRGAADLAGTMQFKHSALIAATARLAYEYEKGASKSFGQGLLSMETLGPFFEKNRVRLERSAESSVRFQTALRRLVPLSHVCFVHFCVASHHPQKADEFIEKLATGAGMKKHDAILMFRNRMATMKGEKHSMLMYVRIALIIKTWNDFFMDRPVGLVRWRPDLEVFPKFEGLDEVEKEKE